VNIAQFLTASAQRRPQHPALRTKEVSLTFGELNERVDQLARGLSRAGIQPGQVCVLMMPNSPEWVMAYYALAKLGAVVVPVNFLYRVGELAHIFRDSGARAFIGHASHLEYAAQVLAELPRLDIRIVAGGSAPGFAPLESFFAEPGEFPTHPAADDDPFAIIYTSGTTGLAKGAMLTHGNLASNAQTLATMRHNEDHYVILGVLPLFHIYGQTSSFNTSICLGITLRLWAHFEAEEIMAALEEEEAAVFIGVPTMYNRLAELGTQHPPQRFPLKYCISGGASLPVEILHRFQNAFKATIYEGYGLTECSPVCVENPFGQPTKPGSIGRPITGFQARVVDELDHDVVQGEVGELIVQGPGVMKGYLNQPEATAQALKGGWLHTGDLARQDEDGYIYIVDRKKDMIIRGGYNVYPREIEEVLYQHPAVLEVAVVGIPHPDLGEEVCAVVVPREDVAVTPDELRLFVKERVAPYKYPRQVRLVQELPKTTTGKLLKRSISR
jgi:long-chain acyl-CoA synthetase